MVNEEAMEVTDSYGSSIANFFCSRCRRGTSGERAALLGDADPDAIALDVTSANGSSIYR